MGVVGNEFIHFRMEAEYYNDLDHGLKQHLDIYKIDVENVDYSHDELWDSLKKKSVRAYKDLKNREYDIRHGKNV